MSNQNFLIVIIIKIIRSNACHHKIEMIPINLHLDTFNYNSVVNYIIQFNKELLLTNLFHF